MKTSLFIDSDILFHLLAINSDKRERFKLEGTTGDPILDNVINKTIKYSKKVDNILLSNFSLLEILVTLKRINSGFKIPEIMRKVYNTYEILSINDTVIYLAWYLGSKYKMHSGDAIHISFCLVNKIDFCLIKDKEVFNSLNIMKNNFDSIKINSLEVFYLDGDIFGIDFELLIESLRHLKEINYIRI